ncbi:hypothetical protein [Anaeromyxobacter paludicola]|uniref:hypothetical protein n=1 Tax=Anaeromyxobacter paludicola TaxID=2918171 RepID=UPI0020BED178|nr:hypothetical protein [Anaeromyxobacter paludicola]
MFALFWCVLGVFGGSRLLRDPGTFWHILTGERILSVGFPHSDWLTFTYQGRPWIAQQWLGELVMAVTYRWGGWDGLVVLTSGVMAAVVAWIFRRLAGAGLELRWALLAAALTLLGASHHLVVRPHIASIAFFACEFGLLVDFEEGRRPASHLALLVPLFLVWANVHGAVVGGLATFGLATALWIGLHLAGSGGPISDRREALIAAALLVASLGSVLVNPYGRELPRAWASILRSPELPRYIVEHASVLRTGTWQLLALGAGYLIVLAGARRWAKASSLLTCIWLVLACQRVRHAPFFAVSAGLSLAVIVPDSGVRRWLAAHGIELMGQRSAAVTRTSWRAWAAAMVAVLALVCGWHQLTGGRRAFTKMDARWWPVRLIPPLRQAAQEEGVGAPVLNDMRLGGFVEFYAPSLRVFVDDRWELFGDRFMVNHLRPAPSWVDSLEHGDAIRLAIAERGGALERHLSSDPTWRLIATSEAGTLYRRTLAEEPAVIQGGARRTP